jgi:uncharacterized protein (TIGR02246 family)
MDAVELSDAFDAYLAAVEKICETGEGSAWSGFAELFAPDATYLEHAYGTFSGREEIRNWIVETMSTYPGNQMVGFPITWRVLDADNNRVVCEIRNVMRDPGDGSVHDATNITILTYAGDGLWAREEDVYNPQKFVDMMRTWSRVARDNRTLSAEGEQFLQALGG